MYKISTIISLDNLKEDEMVATSFEDKEIIFLKKNNSIIAFSAKCPHGGTLLTEGYVDAKNCIVCPTHFYKFNLKTGKEILDRDYRLKIFKTFQQNEEWMVEI